MSMEDKKQKVQVTSIKPTSHGFAYSAAVRLMTAIHCLVRSTVSKTVTAKMIDTLKLCKRMTKIQYFQ